jgi:hypothetical protein|tara:strand:+ start:1759 stop:1941 length:183 start_codon:yes stop_codon:yes gene_type:complete
VCLQLYNGLSFELLYGEDGFIKKSKMPYSPSGKYFYKRYTNGRCDRRFLRYSIKPDNYNE